MMEILLKPSPNPINFFIFVCFTASLKCYSSNKFVKEGTDEVLPAFSRPVTEKACPITSKNAKCATVHVLFEWHKNNKKTKLYGETRLCSTKANCSDVCSQISHTEPGVELSCKSVCCTTELCNSGKVRYPQSAFTLLMAMFSLTLCKVIW